MAPNASARRAALAAVLFLAGSLLFAATCCQAPLYYSNQNQYFLHGLADAGVGLLREDWLANTRDPTPVFSGLVALTARALRPWAFYLYYGLLFGVYGASMLGLFVHLAGTEVARRRWPVFVALFLAFHSALVRWCSYRWLGNDYPWFFRAGVAGQYILGPVLQPSTFGVLLVAAVSLFVHDRPFLASACCGLAVSLHSTYLLSAGLLTAGFLVALLREGKPRRAFWLAVWALVLVLPVTTYVLHAFGPTSPETFARAQDILVNFRIPHHTRPDRWFDPIAALQIAWGVGAITLCLGTRLFPVLVVPFALAGVLTLVQVLTGSDTLALLFPWRISSVLVPVATTVLLSRLVALPRKPPLTPQAEAEGEGLGVRGLAGLAVAGLVAGGVWIMATRQAFQSAAEERAVVDFVRRTRASGDVYFVPVSVPPLRLVRRGSLWTSDFKPLRDKRQDVRVIPVDLQGFRLAAGVPIYVDFKSVPYKDVEVIEWRERVRQAQAVQGHLKEGRLPEALAELRRLGVTHLIVPARQGVRDPGLEQIHTDSAYVVYRLREGGG